jgi:hypothetical protein
LWNLSKIRPSHDEAPSQIARKRLRITIGVFLSLLLEDMLTICE